MHERVANSSQVKLPTIDTCIDALADCSTINQTILITFALAKTNKSLKVIFVQKRRMLGKI